MTPLGWLRLGARNTPAPAPATLPVDDRGELAARATPTFPFIDRSEPTCPPQREHMPSAPAYDGSPFGMCNFSHRSQ